MADRETARALLERAQHALEVGRCEDAIGFVTRCLAADPESVEGHCVLARAHLALGRAAEGLRAAERASALGPDEEWPHRLRSIAHLALGRKADALAAAETCAKLAPTLPDALYTLADAQLACGRKKDALDTARRLRGIAPADAMSHFMLGSIALTGRSWRQAEQHFRKALELDPESSVALNNLAVALERQGKRREAIDRLHDAARTDPRDSLARENLGRSVGRYIGGGLGALFVFFWLVRAATGNAARTLEGPVGEFIAAAGPFLVLAATVGFIVCRAVLRRKRLAALHPTVARFYADERRRARRRLPLEVAFIATVPFAVVWGLLVVFGTGRPRTAFWGITFSVLLVGALVSTALIVRRELADRRARRGF